MKNKLCACFIGLALLAGVHQLRGQAPVIRSTNSTPAGMALIPAGTFTKGDTWDGPTDAIPTNIYVSDFYRDTNLVSYSQPTAAPPSYGCDLVGFRCVRGLLEILVEFRKATQ